jgi:hypothetical protein
MKPCHNAICMNPVFSHGYCKNHQYLRTDSKYIDKQKDKRLRQYYPVKKVTRGMNFGFKNEGYLFMSIWEDRPHICQFTGESLEQFYDTDFWPNCFLHILPKGKFPLFKLNPENIILGLPEFHRIVDAGTKADRLKHPAWDWIYWDELVIKLKEEYSVFLKRNLLTLGSDRRK